MDRCHQRDKSKSHPSDLIPLISQLVKRNYAQVQNVCSLPITRLPHCFKRVCMNNTQKPGSHHTLISLNVQNPESEAWRLQLLSHPLPHTHTSRLFGGGAWPVPLHSGPLKPNKIRRLVTGIRLRTRICLLLLTCKATRGDGKHTHRHFYRRASTCSAPKASLVSVPHSVRSSRLPRERNWKYLINCKFPSKPSLKILSSMCTVL